jgi:hypothetical protein
MGQWLKHETALGSCNSNRKRESDMLGLSSNIAPMYEHCSLHARVVLDVRLAKRHVGLSFQLEGARYDPTA